MYLSQDIGITFLFNVEDLPPSMNLLITMQLSPIYFLLSKSKTEGILWKFNSAFWFQSSRGLVFGKEPEADNSLTSLGANCVINICQLILAAF